MYTCFTFMVLTLLIFCIFRNAFNEEKEKEKMKMMIDVHESEYYWKSFLVYKAQHKNIIILTDVNNIKMYN